jgi:hypothetical protein
LIGGGLPAAKRPDRSRGNTPLSRHTKIRFCSKLRRIASMMSIISKV